MILLIGASVRALMESAAESGYTVTGLDFFGDLDANWQGRALAVGRDCGLTPNMKNLLSYARTVKAQGLIYGAGPENYPAELGYWAEKNQILGNGPKVLEKVRNPWQLKRALAEIGARMPAFMAPGEHYLEKLEGSWLLKPLDRGGGHGIIELSENEDVVSILSSKLANSCAYIIQQYIEGISASVSFLANGREAVTLGTSLQLSENRGEKHGSFRYAGNIVPLALPQVLLASFSAPWTISYLRSELARIIQHLVLTFRLVGINTLDFIINSQGIWILEVNPRWSGSIELIEKYLGHRLFSYHLAGCQGKSLSDLHDNLEANKSQFRFWGKIIIYAHSPLEVRVSEQDLKVLYRYGMRDIPVPGTRIEKGEPLCTVVAGADSCEDCRRILKLKEERLVRFMERGDGCEVRRIANHGSDGQTRSSYGEREVFTGVQAGDLDVKY